MNFFKPPRAAFRPRTRPCLLPLLAAVALAAAATAAAEPAGRYVGAAAALRLAGGEGLRASSSGKNASLALAPDHPATAGIRSAVAAERPGIVVEALFLWRRPYAANPAAEALTAYDALRAVGSLQGIEYYSASRKKIWPLYEYSSLVAGQADDTPVRDARLAALPPVPESLYARQKATTSGDKKYRVSLASGNGYVTQASTNLTRMSLGFVPVAAPGDVNVRLLVVSTDDGLLFYAASSARAAVVPGVRGTLETSFGNPAEAVYRWFSDRLSAGWPPRG